MISYPSEGAQKIAGLDHLRALAITLVFLFHYRLFDHPAWIDTIGSFGWTGVDLFFVLSGYLIASQVFGSIQRGTFSLREFFIKRSFRILPAYWFVLALYFLIPSFREWESLSPSWKFLTFTQNFGLDLRYYRTFSHAWSLCIEEQFYLLLPLTVMLLVYLKTGRKSILLIAGLFALGFALRITSWNVFVKPTMNTGAFGLQWYKWIYYPSYNRLDGLLAGVCIAGLTRYFRGAALFVEKNANVLLAGGTLIISCAWFLCTDQMSFSASVFAYPLIAAAFGLMVASATSARSILNKVASRITSSIATISYSIYLMHKAAIHLAHVSFAKLDIAPDGTLMFLLSTIVSVAGAIGLHYCVEKPFLRLRKKVLAKRKKEASAFVLE
jgi:peptidoglycan/LPS O-acetylase OafA/YrhL